jgi:FKBP-type peptidyl-prolyl cis-trans isomerase (trigger factor)
MAHDDSLEKRANSSVALFVTVPGTLTKKAYDQACQRLANDRKLAIPGFRKGQKVPEQVLLNAVGGPQYIINEALDILCEDALKNAIDEADIKAIGQVRVGSLGVWRGVGWII